LSSSIFLAIDILSKSNQIPVDQFACARLFMANSVPMVTTKTRLVVEFCYGLCN
jgi:hypothetical protein